ITARLQMGTRQVLSEEAKELMRRLRWHGNVRELQNVMERVVQLVPSQVITPQDLELCLDFVCTVRTAVTAPSPPPARATQGRHVTREDILRALEENRYNRTMAAAALGISRKTFYRKLEEFQIEL